MYPKNAATPPRIAIGAVIAIADGAVQSSGVSVVVRAEGGAETPGGGTITYGASSNVVYYAPTQAETNYIAFVATAYKTGCIPVSQTIVPTESSVAGEVVMNATAAAALTVGTVTTLTNLPAIPDNWLTAAGIEADAVTKIQANLALSSGQITVANILAAAIEGALTVKDFLRVIGAVCVGKASGGGTTSITFDSVDGVTSGLAVMTVETATGNRTNVAFSLS